MTKTVCDICGKVMPTETLAKSIKDYNFCISSQGRAWDICNECREGLNEFIKKRKAAVLKEEK